MLTVTMWHSSDLESAWSNFRKTKNKNIIYVAKQGLVAKHIVPAWTISDPGLRLSAIYRMLVREGILN